MRFFILYPFSGGVRGLHRFLLTRSVVTVLSGLSGGLLPGSHFAEGDVVEPPHAALDADVERALGSALSADLNRAHNEAAPDALVCDPALAPLSCARSARGEGRPVEVARLDAPFGADLSPLLP